MRYGEAMQSSIVLALTGRRWKIEHLIRAAKVQTVEISCCTQHGTPEVMLDDTGEIVCLACYGLALIDMPRLLI